MQTITKRFGSFPAAHRQHLHAGHCSFVHGHNWDIEVELSSHQLDGNGFVLDFGKMGFIKEYLADLLDHRFLVNENDPHRAQFEEMERVYALFSIRIVPNGSCESLCSYIGEQIDAQVRNRTGGNVWLKRVTIYEDEKNSATRWFSL
jgi:6-pyruvoyltetrahydropterin/6-carboxytetrahydropterin synthase